MDRIVVVGGEGFIGSWTVPLLRKKGWNVTVWGRERWSRPSGDFVIVNLIRPEGVLQAAETTRRLVALGKWMLTVSSSAIHSYPWGRYAASKAVQEFGGARAGPILRLPHVWGAVNGDGCVLDHWLNEASLGHSLRVDAPGRRLDFVHVTKVAEAIAAMVALHYPPRRVVELWSGATVWGLEKVAAAVAGVFNVPVVIRKKVSLVRDRPWQRRWSEMCTVDELVARVGGGYDER